ncbi:MAG: EAL domain-containing protein [Rhizobiales bacterium]|nr:EAL domain-containing protein [Hyphomicrobiales bacterium]NRB13582.1 EAL domain-containing protein [Hyphomicrobiales bacterium]
MSYISRLISFVGIDENQAELNRERFNEHAKQIPLMCAMLIINLVCMVYPHWQQAPALVIIVLPAILIALVSFRSYRIYRDLSRNISDAEVIKALRGTRYMFSMLGIIVILLSYALLYYAKPDMQIQVVYFLYMTLIGCIFFSMYILQSAVLITFIIMVPSFIFLVFLEDTIFSALAINGLLVSIVIISLVFTQYKRFKGLVKQKAVLLRQGERLRQLNDENKHLANIDTLTSLPNRRRFFTQLDELILRAEQHKNNKIIVGLIDLDGFKRVNDIFGHPTGDDLLIRTSQRLQDILGPGISLSRLGGDEFGLVMTQQDDINNVLEIGEKICDAMRTPFHLRDGTVQIAATVGFVEYPTMADNSKLLFERADYALCYSKQNSKGEPVLFSIEHEQIIREIARIEQQLNEADLDQELSIMFQPVVDIYEQRTSGFEALARWNNSVLGQVRPDIFIRSAEQMGTIGKLTTILLKKALDAASEWPEGLYMSFNLSTYDLASSQTILNIINIIEKSDFPSRNIVFEVTETAVMDDFEKANEALNLLKLQGAKIALDDFGTGYSSLSYVQRLPLEGLKIDRSFINEIANDENTKKIVQTIVTLCKNLHLRCVVEGVETKAQLVALEKVGCRHIQGFYFSKPLTPSKALEYLAQEITIPPEAMHAGWKN